MQNESSIGLENDSIKIVRLICSGKWKIFASCMIFMLGGAAVAYLMPKVYRSEVLLAPSEDLGMPGISGQLGGLASLAGVSIEKDAVSEVTIGVETLKSRVFVSRFVRERKLEVPLLASKEWKKNVNQIMIDEKIYDQENKIWKKKYESIDGAPTDQDIYLEFVSSLSVNQDKKTGLIRVSLDHASPIYAQQWLVWFIDDVNNYIRQRDINEAQRSLGYLREQLSKTSLADLHQVFYQLIEKQTQKIMLANVRDEYVFKVIDPPVVPLEAQRPRKFAIILLSAFVGVFLSAGFVLVQGASKVGLKL